MEKKVLIAEAKRVAMELLNTFIENSNRREFGVALVILENVFDLYALENGKKDV